MKHFPIHTTLDAIAEPEITEFAPLGMLLAGILIAAVAVVTYLLIRRFYGKKK